MTTAIPNRHPNDPRGHALELHLRRGRQSGYMYEFVDENEACRLLLGAIAFYSLDQPQLLRIKIEKM